ncbi:MAG: DnaB-like helicase N-terminal domain-containing protein, partial [Planctomycetota bacterium]|nr:DnaB-like helicase N-terminal domain-containing protein [Planctomycetota bacterium]
MADSAPNTLATYEKTRARRMGQGSGPESVGKLFDQLPPHSLEAEMSLLGSLILDPRVTPDIVGMIKGGDSFYSAAHASIFDALMQLYERHQAGDLVQLMAILRDRGTLEDVGGAEYLVRLGESVPSSANAIHYARIVAEKARLRRLIDAAGQMLYDAYHAGELGPDGARTVLD